MDELSEIYSKKTEKNFKEPIWKKDQSELKTTICKIKTTLAEINSR